MAPGNCIMSETFNNGFFLLGHFWGGFPLFAVVKLESKKSKTKKKKPQVFDKKVEHKMTEELLLLSLFVGCAKLFFCQNCRRR